MSLTPKQVLEGAAAHVEKYGLHKGELQNPNGLQCCALGALLLTAFDEANYPADKHDNVAAFQGARDRLMEMMPIVTHSLEGPVRLYVGSWNDLPSTIAADVVKKLRETAKTFDMKAAS